MDSVASREPYSYSSSNGTAGRSWVAMRRPAAVAAESRVAATAMRIIGRREGSRGRRNGGDGGVRRWAEISVGDSCTSHFGAQLHYKSFCRERRHYCASFLHADNHEISSDAGDQMAIYIGDVTLLRIMTMCA